MQKADQILARCRSYYVLLKAVGARLRTVSQALVIAIALFATTDALAVSFELCGSVSSRGGGPFDYNNPEDVKRELPRVESYHFGPVVQQLRAGMRGRVSPIPDLTYVLRTFPNHHRALDALSRYYLRQDRPPVPGSPESADCWFYYAMKFAPDDSTVWMLYGIFLHRSSRHDEALERYERALAISPESASIHYNLGLLYLDMADLEASKLHAQRAYDLNYPLPGLRTRLQKAGAWND